MKSIFRVIRNFTNEDLKKQEAISFIVGERISEKIEVDNSSPSGMIEMANLKHVE
jgi:hypothetical protein